jgi:hypothetical protein
MDPLTASALIGAVPAVVQAGTGIWQMQQAKKLAKNNIRPNMQTPDAVMNALANSRSQAMQTKLPGQDLIESKIDASVATNVNNLKEVADSPAALMGAVNQAYVGGMDKKNDIAIAAASRFDQNQSQYQDMLGKVGEYEMQNFMFNKADPYMKTAAAASALKEGGMRNIYGGINNAAGAASKYMDGKAQQNQTAADNAHELKKLEVMASMYKK